MRSAVISILVFFAAASPLVAGDLAVIPYKVESSERGISRDIDLQYARYLGIAATNGRELGLYKQYQLVRDLRNMGISYTSTLTLDECSLLAKRRMLSYVVSGTVYGVSGGYVAKSFLYSSSRNTIIARSSVKAASLGELAEKDVSSLFTYDLKSRPSKRAEYDSALMLDASFNMSAEIPEVRGALISYYGSFFSDRPGARLYVLPFSTASSRKPVSITSYPAFKRWIGSLSTGGGSSDQSVTAVMSSLVNNVPWRRSSEKFALMISNTPAGQSSRITGLTNLAAAKKIPIHVLIGAGIGVQERPVYAHIGEASGGSVSDIAYHQLFRDQDNREYHMYYRSGRFYTSSGPYENWRSGAPLSSLNQLFIQQKNITPYSFERYYRQSMGGVVLNKGDLETDLNYQLQQVYSRYARKKSLEGRILVDELGTTLWADVERGDDFESFRKMEKTGMSFLLGVRLVPDVSSPYGYSFHPGLYSMDLGIDDVPDDLVIPLKKLLKNPEVYAADGFLSPPLWFINVKIAEVRRTGGSHDIRSG